MNPNALSAKNHAAGHLFCWTLRKNALIIGIASALSLFVRPGLLLVTFFEYFPLASGHASYLEPIIYGQVLTALIACVLILLLFSINFRYLHSKNESDLFHALPMRRTGLLLTRFAATVTGAAIPIVVSTVGEIALIPLLNSEQVTLLSTLYSTLLQLVLIFAASTMTLLFCVMVGNTFDLIVSLLVVNGGWVAVYAIMMNILSNFLIGFVPTDTGWFALSPFARLLFMFTDMVWTGSGGKVAPNFLFLAYWLIFSAVMLTLAIVLGKRRKNEAAGQPFAYTGMRYISMSVVAILAGYLLGGVFSSNDTRLPGFYVFFILGAFLGAVICGAIATRGFKTLVKSLVTGGVCSALFIAVVLMAWFDPLGYSGFVPKADSIESVTMDMSVWLVDGYEIADGTLSDPESIAAVVDIHEAILSDSQMLYENAINSENPYDDGANSIFYESVTTYAGNPGGTITLHYKTKSGLTIDRRFSLNYTEPIEDKLLNLVTSREYIEQTDPLLTFEAAGGDPAELSEVIITTFTPYSNAKVDQILAELIKQDPAKAKALYEAYKQDLATITPENKSNEELYRIEFCSATRPDIPFYLQITRAHKNVLRLLGWDDFDAQTDPLLAFEKRGGDLSEIEQLRVIILTDEEDYPTDILTAERPGLAEQICEAYREDVQENHYRSDDTTLCNIQFFSANGQYEFELDIDATHQRTLQVLKDHDFTIFSSSIEAEQYYALEAFRTTRDTGWCTEIYIDDHTAAPNSAMQIAAADHPELADQLVEAYALDMEADIANRSTVSLCHIKLLNQRGDDIVNMYVTVDCSNTLRLLAEEKIAAIDPDAALVGGWSYDKDYVSEWNALFEEPDEAVSSQTDANSGWRDSSGKEGVMSYNFETEQWESDSSAPIPVDENDPIFSDTTASW